MIHQQIKELFFSSVEHIVSDISQYAVHPDSDFKRSKKIPAQKLISFLVSQGSSSTRVEMFYPQLGVKLCSMAEVLGMTQSAISHQLRMLKQMKLVKNRREGKTVFYSLADDHIQTIMNQGMEHILE